MANAEYLAELVRAHYAGDDRRFTNLLNQVIAAESRAGHARLAERLRELRIECATNLRHAPLRSPVPRVISRRSLMWAIARSSWRTWCSPPTRANR